MEDSGERCSCVIGGWYSWVLVFLRRKQTHGYVPQYLRCYNWDKWIQQYFSLSSHIYCTWRATGRYFAASDEESTIFALTTDPSNEMLITGDSNGTISVWDISSYCISRAEAIVAQVGWSFFQRRDVLLIKICKVTGFSNHLWNFRLY